MRTAGSTRQARALLVDDNAKTRAVHLRRLTDDGYTVTTASDPVIALALATQSRPNVIFVHIGRRGSGSTAFIVALRSADDTRNIPVSVLTSYYNPALERLGLTAVAPENW